MGNEVANPFGKVLDLKDKKAMAARAQQSAAAGTATGGAPDGSVYMNFSGKRGMYEIGQNKRAPAKDELWLINIASLEDGYVCWKGGKPLATRMANIFSEAYPVAVPDSNEGGPFDPNKGEGWFAARSWVCKSLDEDEQAYFKNNSVSGVAEMSTVIEEIGRRMAAGQACWPVISYGMEGFEARGFKNYKPIFDIYGWLNDAAVAELAADPDADLDDLIGKSAVTEMLTKDEEPVEEEGSDPATAPKQETTGRRRRRSA